MSCPFFSAIGLELGDVAAIIGAGGKSSLMFRLAREARSQGMRVLVTTSTLLATMRTVSYIHPYPCAGTG